MQICRLRGLFLLMCKGPKEENRYIFVVIGLLLIFFVIKE